MFYFSTMYVFYKKFLCLCCNVVSIISILSNRIFMVISSFRCNRKIFCSNFLFSLHSVTVWQPWSVFESFSFVDSFFCWIFTLHFDLKRIRIFSNIAVIVRRYTLLRDRFFWNTVDGIFATQDRKVAPLISWRNQSIGQKFPPIHSPFLRTDMLPFLRPIRTTDQCRIREQEPSWKYTYCVLCIAYAAGTVYHRICCMLYLYCVVNS